MQSPDKVAPGSAVDVSPARSAILDKLRRQIVVEHPPLPEVISGEWIRYEDPVMQFTQAVEAVGASCVSVQHPSEIAKHLEGHEIWRNATKVFSQVPEVPGNVDLAAIDAPHALDDLDFVVYRGQFGVAENGAVWVSDQDLRHRVVFFITQFLVLVVSRDQIVHHMHEAYARLQLPRPGFGLFLAGPSKTADIEQSLVVGAHGCKQLQVFIV
ncbi:MAG: hypothetical protein KatS3mg111_0266 [Pirellulaceae bacterium]|nr:MAG: hypothetical protein KatS3mg111_0266 [Pirellulaceae bacterium]